MNNSSIRVLLILAVIALAGIISTQIVLLNKAIDQQDQVFSHNVQVALRNVVESLCEASGKEFPLDNPIEQVSKNYFIVRTNDQIDLKLLEYLITAEIAERSIIEDFEYGVYDCQNDQMVYADNINLVSLEHKDFFPILKEEEYYFGIYFPNRSKSLNSEMDIWKFTSVLTLVVVVFFAYGLFVILRQKRLSEVQRDFVNNMSHELKTPLATLSLASNTLKSRLQNNEKKYAEIISEETERLQDHIEKIMTGSLLEKGIEIDKKEFEVKNFINQIAERFSREYSENDIEWEVGSEGGILKSDPELIDNILSNLVDNAVKYGAKKVMLKSFKKKSGFELIVEDNGDGIPINFQKKVFNRFYRVPQAGNQHNTKGFGLGLYIVKKSIGNLNGKIKLISTPGKGTTFIIAIPNG